MDSLPSYSLLLPEKDRYDPKFYRLLLEVEQENFRATQAFQSVGEPNSNETSTLNPHALMITNKQVSSRVEDMQILREITASNRNQDEVKRNVLEPRQYMQYFTPISLTTFSRPPRHVVPETTTQIFRTFRRMNQTGTPELRARVEYQDDIGVGNFCDDKECNNPSENSLEKNLPFDEYVPLTGSVDPHITSEEPDDELDESDEEVEDDPQALGSEIDVDDLPQLCEGYSVNLRPKRRKDTGYATLGTFPVQVCASSFRYLVKIESTFFEVGDEEFTFCLIAVDPMDEETCYDVDDGVEYELLKVENDGVVPENGSKVYVYQINFTVTSFSRDGANFKLLIQCKEHKQRLEKLYKKKTKEERREFRLHDLFRPRLGDLFLSASFKLVARKTKSLDDKFWNRFLEFPKVKMSDREKKRMRKRSLKRRRKLVEREDDPLRKRLRRRSP